MKSRMLLVVGFVVVISSQVLASAQTASEEKAEKASRESGRPLLIVVGRHTCGITQAVLEHLGEPALAPALSPYVSVFVDIDGAEGRTCKERYGAPGKTLPFVYVVRADGQKLYSHSGHLESGELRDMLLSEAARAGKSLSLKETVQLRKALDEARRARKDGNLGEAIKALLPLKKLGPLGSINCYSTHGVEANQFVAQLTEEGKSMLQKVDEGCANGKPTLDAMLTYVKARREFAPLPTLKADLTTASHKYEHGRTFAELLAQAQSLDRAQITATDAHNSRNAAAAYKKIVSTYPDTEAARRAAEQLKNLPAEEAGPPAEDDAQPEYRIWTDTTGQFNIKARFAGIEDDKVLLETEDGRTIRVPLEKLGETDQKLLKSHAVRTQYEKE